MKRLTTLTNTAGLQKNEFMKVGSLQEQNNRYGLIDSGYFRLVQTMGLFSFLLFCSLITFGQDQVIFLSTERYECRFNAKTDQYSDCTETDYMATVFVADDRFSSDSFVHITPFQVSTYTLYGEAGEEPGMYYMDVESEAGNKYRYIFDFTNALVLAVFLNPSEIKGEMYRVAVFNIANTLIR